MDQLASDEGPAPLDWSDLPARVTLVREGAAISCALSSINEPYLVLDVLRGAEAPRALDFGDVVTVRVTHRGRCMESDTRVRQWVIGRNPQVVVGPITAWRESGDRAAARIPGRAGARLRLSDGTVLLGPTLDLSATGARLDLPGSGPEIGALGRLTLELNGDFWCEDQRVRVARVQRRFGSIGRKVEVAVQILPESADDLVRWAECLARCEEPGTADEARGQGEGQEGGW